MITIRIDESTAVEVAEVITDIAGSPAFKGTIPTRTLAENLLAHVAGVKGARVDGWLNLLGTPANTAWKLQGSGKLVAVTYFPPREVAMQVVHPFVRDMGTREFRAEELCLRPLLLPGSVWVGSWSTSGVLVGTGFMLCPDPPNPGDFLSTPLRSFDFGNVYEHGRLCWGNAIPTAPLGNLFALDRFFFQESVNNYHLARHQALDRWWGRQFFGLQTEDLWIAAQRTIPAGRDGQPRPRLSWAQVVAEGRLPDLPAKVEIPLGTSTSTLERLLGAASE